MQKNNKAIHPTTEVRGLSCQIIVNIVASLLTFRDFEYDDEPVVSITSSSEMILDWRGYEMPIESALPIMETVGYICPIDFDATYGRW